MEELCTLSAGRWGITISQVEPGTVEHNQGARTAVSVYCDGEPFVAYAFAETRHGEGALTEDGRNVSEQPDFVGFVLSRRDVQKLEFLLARVHHLLRGGGGSAGAADPGRFPAPLAESDREAGDGTRIIPRGPGTDGDESR